ncbi:MAG: hypothetical protein ACE3L7_32570 [Candidatus Pristimantibacillus sp.]|nr:hypothetical protein [Paenibacillus sp. LS1]MCW3793875.1 hypothetical protein [Paenibacillus sp. LS1]
MDKMDLSKVTNALGGLADQKVKVLSCIGWIHSPKPPAELLKQNQSQKEK